MKSLLFFCCNDDGLLLRAFAKRSSSIVIIELRNFASVRVQSIDPNSFKDIRSSNMNVKDFSLLIISCRILIIRWLSFCDRFASSNCNLFSHAEKLKI